MITVLQPGLLTTLQDEGRLGYQKYGVPVAGAMDSLALHTANLLAGNDMGEACLEITGLAATLRFETPVAFALSGGEFSPIKKKSAAQAADLLNCVYSALIAPTGQPSSQAPQSMQVSASTMYFVSPGAIAFTGQVSAQAPQEMHSSEIT